MSATTSDATGALPAPTDLVADPNGADQIDLSWEYSPLVLNETGFGIERSSDGITGWASVGSVGANIVEFSDNDNLQPNTVYFYRVKAVNNDSESLYSNVAQGETGSLPNVLPGAPEDLTAVAASAIQVTLTWEDTANNETGFHVYRANSADAPVEEWTQLTRVYTNGHWRNMPLAPNTESYTNSFSSAPVTTYYYKVVAFNAEGTAESNIASVTTPPVPTSLPAAPTNFAVTALPGLEISATWTDNATNEYHYIVQKKETVTWVNCYLYQGQGAAANVTSYEGTCGLTAGTTYSFRVIAENPAGASHSNTVSGVLALP